MTTTKLSTVIITLNEEKKLGRALESAKKISDEFVVIDSGSIDKTVDIAKRFGAKVYSRKFDNYAAQKNYAAEKATGSWLLFLDADEEISPELAGEIEERITINDEVFTAFSIPRKNIIFGKFIRYTRWQPELDRHIWLYKKNKGKWKGQVHEEVEVSGEVGRLKNFKVHYQYETVHDFMNMMNRYSEIDAKVRVEKGTKFTVFRLFFDPIYNFLVRYFYRMGILDGWRGFVLSFLMEIYHLELWIKIWEKERR